MEGPGEVIGYGSANPVSEENYYDTEAMTYEGRIRAAVRANGTGKIKVTFTTGDKNCSVTSRQSNRFDRPGFGVPSVLLKHEEKTETWPVISSFFFSYMLQSSLHVIYANNEPESTLAWKGGECRPIRRRVC